MHYPRFEFHENGFPLYSKECDIKGCQILAANPFRFWFSENEYIDMEVGDIVNGASVPWLFQLLYNPFDSRYKYSPDFHDVAVGEKDQPKRKAMINGELRELTWREADIWFRAGLTLENDDEELQWTFYEAVMLKKRPTQWLKKITS